MRFRRPVGRVLALVGAAVLSLPVAAVPARAQDVPLAQVLPDLVLREIVLLRGGSGASAPGALQPPHQRTE